MSRKKHGEVMHYCVEFMKFLCGFAFMLGVSLTFLYFTTAGVSAA